MRALHVDFGGLVVCCDFFEITGLSVDHFVLLWRL